MHHYNLTAELVEYFHSKSYRELPELLECVADWLRETNACVEHLAIENSLDEASDEAYYSAFVMHSGNYYPETGYNTKQNIEQLVAEEIRKIIKDRYLGE